MDVSWNQLKGAAAAFDKQESPQILGQPQENLQGFDFVAIGTQGLIMLCDFLGQPERLGEHWKTTPEEAEGLARAIDGVMPDDFNVSPWGALFIAAGVFVAPRAAITMVQNKQKQKQPATAKPNQQQNTARPQPAALSHNPKPKTKSKPPAQAISSRNN